MKLTTNASPNGGTKGKIKIMIKGNIVKVAFKDKGTSGNIYADIYILSSLVMVKHFKLTSNGQTFKAH